jgi:hypothetical protein
MHYFPPVVQHPPDQPPLFSHFLGAPCTLIVRATAQVVEKWLNL